MTTRTSYYMNDFTDEGGEFGGSLAKIATDCGNEDFEFRPAPGEPIASTRIEYTYVPCPRGADGNYQIPQPLPGTLHAMTFGDGGGWLPDMLAQDLDEAEALLAEYGDEETEYLVCFTATAQGTITFHLDPPRCEWSEAT